MTIRNFRNVQSGYFSTLSDVAIAASSLLLCAACSGASPPEDSLAESHQDVRLGHPATPFGPNTPAVGNSVVLLGLVCSGSVIAPQWVLTAKHCHSTHGESVVSPRPDGTWIERKVDVAYDHPIPEVDAEVVRLDQPFTDISGVPLYSGTSQDIINQQVTVWGYGATCVNDVDCSNGATCEKQPGALAGLCTGDANYQLRYGEGLTVNSFGYPFFITTGSSDGHIFLPGDSGGPAILNGEQVGIDTHVNDFGFPGTNAIVSVAEIREWVISKYRGGVRNDFNSDGKPDIIWHNGVSGASRVSYMNGAQIQSSQDITYPGIPNIDDYVKDSTGWTLAGIGDFNYDGATDVVWHNATSGRTDVWFMNGAQVTSSSTISYPGIPNIGDYVKDSTGWRLVAVNDFNIDGRADLVWHNGVTGATDVWYMNGTQVTSSGTISYPGIPNIGDYVKDPTGWRLAGTGDFDSDGRPDLVWRNGDSGQTDIWYLSGLQVASSGTISAAGGNVTDATGWQIGSIGDFSGDGQPDIVWHNGLTGQNDLWTMSGGQLGSSQSIGGTDTSMQDSSGWKIAGGK